MKYQECCALALLLATCESALGTQATTEQTPSPFIKKKDIYEVTEQQYETPAIIIVGTTDAKLLRCVYGDLETCETINTSEVSIYSVLVVDEYIFVGLMNDLLRCNLNQVGSCQVYQTAEDNVGVYSLTAIKGYLYAGLISGRLLRCRLNEPNSCQVHNELKHPIYGLTQVDEYLYAGLWNGTLMRCSLVIENYCTPIYTIPEEITGFLIMGNSIFVISRNGNNRNIWNCSRTADGGIKSCVSQSLEYRHEIDSEMEASVLVFSGVWYLIEWHTRIHTCKWVRNSLSCTPYGNIEYPTSIAFVYATVYMRGRFGNENKTCVWQRGVVCPQLVPYYNVEQRAEFQIHVKDGRLYNSTGALVDTTDAYKGRAIFAMGPSGRILLSNLVETGALHTSSFFAGGPVAGAGEVVVRGGVVELMTTCSEHYRPSLELNAQVVESLRAQGYTRPVRTIACEQ